jgi:hypothetical protein
LQKYTIQSSGLWEVIRRVFAVDPNRSNGIPMNSQFRNPPSGALPPESYDDPVTLPAADIADNPYWKRDTRRNYPQLSILKQGDVVGLLTLGSRSAPKDNVLQIGEAGNQQLVQIKQMGEEHGMAALFEKDRNGIEDVLGPQGLPPLPCNLNPLSKYEIGPEQGYPSK